MKNLHAHLSPDGIAVYSNEYRYGAREFLDEAFLRHGLVGEVIWDRPLEKDVRFGHKTIKMDTVHAVFKIAPAKSSSAGVKLRPLDEISTEECSRIEKDWRFYQNLHFALVNGVVRMARIERRDNRTDSGADTYSYVVHWENTPVKMDGGVCVVPYSSHRYSPSESILRDCAAFTSLPFK